TKTLGIRAYLLTFRLICFAHLIPVFLPCSELIMLAFLADHIHISSHLLSSVFRINNIIVSPYRNRSSIDSSIPRYSISFRMPDLLTIAVKNIDCTTRITFEVLNDPCIMNPISVWTENIRDGWHL